MSVTGNGEPGYGKGRMTNWDKGTFEAHKIEDGKLVVTLAGERVAGKYSLFSMRGGRDWLIHRMDPPADPQRLAVPYGVEPMRAMVGDLPEGRDWLYEPQWHGIRATVTDDTGRVTILAADGEDLSLRFPEIRRIARAIGHLEVILDGVIVPTSGDGVVRHDRAGLGRRLRIASDSGARNAAKTSPTVFMAFDLLWVEGRPVTDQPLDVRRRQLEDLRLDGPGWRTSPWLGLEDVFDLDTGVVAKRRDSTYQIGETTKVWVTATN